MPYLYYNKIRPMVVLYYIIIKFITPICQRKDPSSPAKQLPLPQNLLSFSSPASSQSKDKAGNWQQ